MTLTELTIDVNRDVQTGCFVRAKNRDDNKYGTYDVGKLDKESFKSWLRSHGGENAWAENFIGQLLGYGILYDSH